MMMEKNIKKTISKKFRRFAYKFTHKRYFRILCLRWAALFLVILVAIPIVSLLIFPNDAKAVDEIEDVSYKYFMQIEIQPGDTLWAIAREYGKGEDDIRNYIKEVRSINHMCSNEIKAGQKITIPYYSTEYYE